MTKLLNDFETQDKIENTLSLEAIYSNFISQILRRDTLKLVDYQKLESEPYPWNINNSRY